MRRRGTDVQGQQVPSDRKSAAATAPAVGTRLATARRAANHFLRADSTRVFKPSRIRRAHYGISEPSFAFDVGKKNGMAANTQLRRCRT